MSLCEHWCMSITREYGILCFVLFVVVLVVLLVCERVVCVNIYMPGFDSILQARLIGSCASHLASVTGKS